MIRLVLLAATLALLVLGPRPGSAQLILQGCSASMTPIAFGPVDVLSGSPASSAGAITVSCQGVPSTTVRVCISLGGPTLSGRRVMTGPTGATLQFNLFSDEARALPWGSYQAGASGVQVDLALGLSGTASRTVPVYGLVYGGQQSAAVGSYGAVLQDAGTSITYAVTLLPCTGLLTNRTAFTGSTSATVQANCGVSAGALDFGAVSALDRVVDGAGTITVRCSLGAPYTIGVGGGGAQAVDPTQRRMSSGARTITYGLFRDAGRQLGWGNAVGTNTVAGVGTAASQTFTVYGRVPAQPGSLAGTYSDTVVVSIEF